MPKYVDGFLLPLPKKNVATYRKMARLGGKIWRDHGALDYKECIGDDMKPYCGLPFPAQMKLKPGEVPVFSWIVFKSRRDRDRINAAVMKDPRMAKMGTPKSMPFDIERMVYGGFEVLVDL
jgi:uncharacterized protein YbaA (DUF1428 family)